MIIDLSEEWSIQKIIRLGHYLLMNFGLDSDASLYIDVLSFKKLLDENSYLSNVPWGTEAPGTLCLYTTNGRMFVSMTNDKDYVEFSINNTDYKYYIVNKRKEYNKDFDEMLND